jgi:hypothetical protein
MRSPRDGVELPEPLDYTGPHYSGDRLLFGTIIQRVVKEKSGRPSVEVYLALGEACPAFTPSDRHIWWDELRKAGL